MATVTLEKVCKSFDRTEVIHDVDLQIDNGDFCCFVGPSGCGKTTLLRLIAGLEEISSGDILIDGHIVNNTPPAQRGIAMVFQSYALYPHMSVYQNMSFGLKRNRTSREEVAQRVRDIARMLEIDQLLDRLPKQLSGGQRQRVAIGRAMVREPQVFLLDEPLSNLDASLRTQTRVELASLHKRLNTTMVYVTHDQVEAMTLANKIVVLHEGRVVQVGAPMELYHAPVNIFVAGFIGSPRMNFIHSTLDISSSTDTRLRLTNGTGIDAGVDTSAIEPGSAMTIGLRPEQVMLTGASNSDLSGEVLFTENLGDHSLVYLQIAGIENFFCVKVTTGESFIEGSVVGIAVPSEACHVFDHDGVACKRISLQDAE
jgi:multiple sugar transport system ATP-binding protein